MPAIDAAYEAHQEAGEVAPADMAGIMAGIDTHVCTIGSNAPYVPIRKARPEGESSILSLEETGLALHTYMRIVVVLIRLARL